MDVEHTDDLDWLKTELNRERIMVSNLVMDSQRLQADLNAQTEKVERLKTALMDSTRSRGILPHVEIAHAHLEMALDVLREDEED